MLIATLIMMSLFLAHGSISSSQHGNLIFHTPHLDLKIYFNKRGPYVITLLNQIGIFEWYVARLIVKNRHHNGMRVTMRLN